MTIIDYHVIKFINDSVHNAWSRVVKVHIKHTNNTDFLQ